MAKNTIHIYKLTEKGRTLGVHTISVGGEMLKIDKYGVVRVPDPGIQHPEAHHLEHKGTEGEGMPNWVDPDLVAKQKAVKDGEDLVKEIGENLKKAKEALGRLKGDAKAEEKQAAEDLVKEIEKALAEANTALGEAKKKAA